MIGPVQGVNIMSRNDPENNRPYKKFLRFLLLLLIIFTGYLLVTPIPETSAPEISLKVEHRTVDCGDIRLHTALAGPENGRPLIFLHGFPEFWYGWRKQIDFFAKQGFRVIVPDQRGYNLSERPAGIENYRVDLLAADVVHLMDALHIRKAVVVGHDWGAAVNWALSSMYPDRIEKSVIINVPHPVIMRETLESSLDQLQKSWYMFFFQIPRIPERLMSLDDWSYFTAALKSGSINSTFTDEDMSQYRRAWSRPGAMTAMLNWYRAALQHPFDLRDKRVVVPLLIIWGSRDAVLGKEMVEPSLRYADLGRIVFFDENTHWVHHEAPERVNTAILNFVNER